jgi:hypothetical protein
MQITIIALGVVLAMLVTSLWWAQSRWVKRRTSEAGCRRDIQALRLASYSRSKGRRSEDVWLAGADTESSHAGSKKAVAWVAIGSVSGGCGGCGCGG